MEYFTALRTLQAALTTPLPGASAHSLLAPRPRRKWPPGFDSAHLRHAAGLLLLFPLDGLAHIVLTLRSDGLLRHGGQVSLPGGVVEPGETIEHAALREAHEEIGLASDAVRTIGALTPVDIEVSGFRLHPVVAAAPSHLALSPSDAEVARILEVGLDQLLSPERVVWRSLRRGGQSLTVPAFQVEGAEIWGATAMVLAEFLSVLGWVGPRLARPDQT